MCQEKPKIEALLPHDAAIVRRWLLSATAIVVDRAVVVSCLSMTRVISRTLQPDLQHPVAQNMAESITKIKIVSITLYFCQKRLTVNDFYAIIDERSGTRFVCCYLSNTRRNTHDRKRSKMDANEKVRHIHSCH
jgi:hypothetical protein